MNTGWKTILPVLLVCAGCAGSSTPAVQDDAGLAKDEARIDTGQKDRIEAGHEARAKDIVDLEEDIVSETGDLVQPDSDHGDFDPGHETWKDPGLDISDVPDDAPFDKDETGTDLFPWPTDSEGDIEAELNDVSDMDPGVMDEAVETSDSSEAQEIDVTLDIGDEAGPDTDIPDTNIKDVVVDYKADESVPDSTDIHEGVVSDTPDSDDASPGCTPVPYELVCSDKTTTDYQWGYMADVNWALTTEERLNTLKYGSPDLNGGAGWGSCMSLEWSTIAADKDHVYVSVADQYGDGINCLCGSQLDGLEYCQDGTLRFDIRVAACGWPCVSGGGDAIFSWTYIVRIPVSAYSPEMKPVPWSHMIDVPAEKYCLYMGEWHPMGLCLGIDDPSTY